MRRAESLFACRKVCVHSLPRPSRHAGREQSGVPRIHDDGRHGCSRRGVGYGNKASAVAGSSLSLHADARAGKKLCFPLSVLWPSRRSRRAEAALSILRIESASNTLLCRYVRSEASCVGLS